MDSPVAFMLANAAGDEDFAISEAGVQVGEWQDDLEGLLSLGLYARFAPGTASSGAGVTVYIQTSFSGGAAFDIACFTFGDTTAAKAANIDAGVGLDPVVVTDQGLTDDTVLDGPIGDRVRAVVVTEGTFSGMSVLSVRGNAR